MSSWSGESSWAGEIRGTSDWFPNSYRFATKEEAEHFIQQTREQWSPPEFVKATRVLQSDQPVNARWNAKKKDAIRLGAADPDDLPAAGEDDENENLLPHDEEALPTRAREAVDTYRRQRRKTRSALG